VAICLGTIAVVPGPAEGIQPQPCVVRADLQGVVTPTSADYLIAALEAAEARRCAALLVVIDTPGGDLESTRRIVQRFLEAKVPVVTWVPRGGSRAGSAGMFLVLAGHVAAMAPGSNIGASHPVLVTGADPERGGLHLGRKVENDAAAFARGIAQRRGRNAAWAERAVRDSLSATAHEALLARVIDVLAVDQRHLLNSIDGHFVVVGGRPHELDTENARVRTFEMSLSQRVRTALADPSLAFVLLLLGVIGVAIEVYSPGLVVPGVLGALALVLALMGLLNLPVTVSGLVLIGVGLALFIAEIYVTSFGLLTLGGAAALLLGAALLVDVSAPDFFADPTVRVSWGAAVPLVVLFAGGAAALAWYGARAQRRRAATGVEGLIGAEGVTLGPFQEGRGYVRVQGERWAAQAPLDLPADTPVVVAGIEGLTLRVAPAAPKEKGP
jgi:membrane-bound serine protease (ClpP class)